MKKVVYVYGMRHGDKEGDALTEEGKEQVRQSCLKNLAGIQIHGYYASWRQRAIQTADLAVEMADRKVLNPIVSPRQGFDYPDDLIKQCGGGEAMNKAAKDLATSRGRTVVLVKDWMDAVPDWTSLMSVQIGRELQVIAMEEAIRQEANGINLFVGNHSPLIETAAVDKSAMPRLREADMVKYTIEVTLGEHCDRSAQIVDSEYIPRGF